MVGEAPGYEENKISLPFDLGGRIKCGVPYY